MSDKRSPYARGWEAATRTGEYAGARSVPDNPYPEGSEDASAWLDGFGDGTDLLIAWDGGELDEPTEALR